ncbi:MAG: hypothetical protein ABSF53_00580 [Terracidiphilus sp.]
MGEMRLGRNMDIQTFEFDSRDANGLALFVAQRSVEAELTQVNQGIVGICGKRHGHALHLRRRPDAQASALGLNAIDQRHVERVQFDAGMKPVVQCVHNACPEKWLGMAQRNDRGNGHGRQHHETGAAEPQQPPIAPPERFANLGQEPLRTSPFSLSQPDLPSAVPVHFPNRRGRA